MFSNRLIHEKSPYLLQHAHNPVDWYPWGEEAFSKARAENKPIFLSIGYSTCHWCHVMERESFENEVVAEVLNRHFVSIKLDREERPDVDRIYMTFIQATSGGGGWPMSVFLTPELKPFYGGTYFPPNSRYGRPGFKDLLEFLAAKWREERGKIEIVGIETLAQLRQITEGDGATHAIDQAVYDRVFQYFRRTFDARLGGFGNAPKFPRPVVLNFLLRYYHLTGNDEALEMVTVTLREMAKGGMNDQLGGGFHRYSVDDRWFVPHFEKMLYDQAQLAISYLEAYQITKEEAFAQTARDIFTYVLRDMTHPEGGFFSAEDADSVIDPANPKEKGEGAFYIWAYDELAAHLTPEELAEVVAVYGVKKNGNVDEDPHHEFTGRNILFIDREPANPAVLASAKQKLLAARAPRVRPGLDDKVLTAWNGLMISAFAKGAQVLNDPLYLDAARRAAHFILRHLYLPETGTLLRRFREGDAAIPGFLDDYAFFAQGLVDLYQAGAETYHLEVALQLATSLCQRFEDPQQGGFFSTAEGDPNLVLRLKEDYDGAEPSGNSIATDLLLHLAHLTNREDLAAAAGRALTAFSGRLAQQGVALPQMLVAHMTSTRAPRQIVLTGHACDHALAEMQRAVFSQFLPGTSMVVITNEEQRAALAHHSPALAAMRPVDGNAAAYLCENFACQLPITSPGELTRALHRSTRA
jgi:uncharacterized protein YyaL (SSP411 family)